MSQYSPQIAPNYAQCYGASRQRASPVRALPARTFGPIAYGDAATRLAFGKPLRPVWPLAKLGLWPRWLRHLGQRPISFADSFAISKADSSA